MSVFQHVSWLWTNPGSYNLWSSSWGEILLKLPLLIWAIRHLTCDINGCHRIGHPVEGTGHRACHHHHPNAEAGGLTVERLRHLHARRHENP